MDRQERVWKAASFALHEVFATWVLLLSVVTSVLAMVAVAWALAAVIIDWRDRHYQSPRISHPGPKTAGDGA